jgi:hypothetical protein
MICILSKKYPMLPRHEQFARTLAVTGDATAAAAQVGYKPGNGLKVTAHRLAQRADVQAVVADERERLAQTQQITNDEIMAGLAGIARDSGSPAAARVSAFRTLADIKGLMTAPQAELPSGLDLFLKAIAAGASVGRQEQVSEATNTLLIIFQSRHLAAEH